VKPIVLDTDRLRLREMNDDDLDFVAGMLADPEVMRYYPKCYSRDEAREWLHRQVRRYQADGCGLWLVEDRATGAPRGQVGLIIQDVDGSREPEIGYLIHRPFWRQGLAFEAASAAKRYAFEGRGVDHVISLIRPENLPSQAVARKLGLSPVRETMFHGYRHLVFHS
jgi:[ribosomal protein S5]-alanine N-acetyltransferase